MNNELHKLSPLEEKVVQTIMAYSNITLRDEEDKTSYELVKRAHIDTKNVRREITKIAKEMKQPMKDLIKQIGEKEADLAEKLKPTELRLQEERQRYEDHQKELGEERQRYLEELFKGRTAVLEGLEFYVDEDYMVKQHDPTTDMDERQMSISLSNLKNPEFEIDDFVKKAGEFHAEVLTAREKRDRVLRKEARIAELTRHGFTDDGTGYAYALCFRGDGEPCETISYDIIEKATDEVFNQELQSCLEARGDYQEEIAKQAKERAEKEAQDRVREVSAMRKKLLQKTLDKEQIEYFNDQKGLVGLGTLSKQKFDELYDQASAYLGHVLAKRIPKMESIGWVVNMEKGQLEIEDGNTIGLTWLRDLPHDKYDELIAPKPVEYEEGEEVLEAEDEPQAGYNKMERAEVVPLEKQRFEVSEKVHGTIVVRQPYAEVLRNSGNGYGAVEYYGGYCLCESIMKKDIAKAICDAWNEKHGL